MKVAQSSNRVRQNEEGVLTERQPDVSCWKQNRLKRAKQFRYCWSTGSKLTSVRRVPRLWVELGCFVSATQGEVKYGKGWPSEVLRT